MAKANMVLPDGTKVTIEGTAEEVALMLSKCSQGSSAPDRKSPKAERHDPCRRASRASRRMGPQTYIAELADEGFFKTKRTLGDIQKKLEERGHIYAKSNSSKAMTRLTRKRILRRIKEEKGWVYLT
jgi:hypothetical protein